MNKPACTDEELKELEHHLGNALLGIVPHYIKISMHKRPWTQEDIDLFYECSERMVSALGRHKT